MRDEPYEGREQRIATLRTRTGQARQLAITQALEADWQWALKGIEATPSELAAAYGALAAERASLDARRARRRGKLAAKLSFKYGITLTRYEAMVAEQGNACRICGLACPKHRLSVDHCHVTGAVRGLLCARCNIGLAVFGDSQALLERAAKYLTGELT